jgi:hypothetical protein
VSDDDGLPTALDVRDDALAAIAKSLEDEGHSTLTATATGIGLVYVDGVGPIYAVEVTKAPA